MKERYRHAANPTRQGNAVISIQVREMLGFVWGKQKCSYFCEFLLERNPAMLQAEQNERPSTAHRRIRFVCYTKRICCPVPSGRASRFPSLQGIDTYRRNRKAGCAAHNLAFACFSY